MPDLHDKNRLGTYHISADLQNYETARSNFFTLLIEDLDDLLYPEFAYTGENPNNQYVTRKGIRSGQEIIKLSVNKTSVPHFSSTPIEIKRGNSVVKFADSPKWDSGTIDLQDFVGLETKNVLMAWQALVYDVVSDTQGRAGDWVDQDGVKHRGYKRNCTLIEYTPDHEQIRYWDLVGCWLSNISESPFEVDGSGGRIISCTLEYDRAVLHMPDTYFEN